MSRAPWLFVSGAEMFGGHEIMMLRLMEELRSQERIEPKLLARRRSPLLARADGFATQVRLAAPVSGRNPLRLLRKSLQTMSDAIAFVRVTFASRPELCIVAEGCILAQPLFTMMARLVGIRVVIYTPLVDPSTDMGFARGPIRDWLVKRVYGNLPNGWITITRQQARTLAAWAHIDRPILTLPNVVDQHIASATPDNLIPFSTARAPRAMTPIRVLVMGRLDYFQKGLDLLLDFLQRECECGLVFGAGFQVSIVGDGTYRGEIENRLAASRPLAQVLSMTPWSDATLIMQQHDALLLPSRFEGVPLVMLEAMALGLPVFATDLPGTRTYLPDECLFRVGDLSAAFSQIERLRDHAVRDGIVTRNRRAFEAGASTTAFSRSVRQLTDELLQLAGAA
jgi:glycosyltransferase involved in cell wall biosynthesis